MVERSRCISIDRLDDTVNHHGCPVELELRWPPRLEEVSGTAREGGCEKRERERGIGVDGHVVGIRR